MLLKESREQEKDGVPSDLILITLVGQNKHELECFLSFVYPETFKENHDGPFWITCFRFAHKWGFDKQKEVALERIFDPSTPNTRPAQAVAVGRTCGKKAEALAPFFVKMLRDPPSKLEGQLLGTDYLVLLCQMQAHHKTFCAKDSRKRLETYVQAVLEGVKADDAPAIRMRLDVKRETLPNTRKSLKHARNADASLSDSSAEYKP